MGIFVQLSIIILLFGGCVSQKNPTQENNEANESKKVIRTAAQEIEDFYTQKEVNEVPKMILAPVFEEVSVFDEQRITFSAYNTNFTKLLHTISNQSGLNLIIDKDVDTAIPITMNVEEAPLEEVLDIVMDLSGCYYVLRGNILHVKMFMRKKIVIPYIHSTTSFDTQLGGDMLNSAQSGGSGGGGGSSGGGSEGIKGSFQLNFNNPKEANGFYEEIQEDVSALLSADGKFTLNRFAGVLNIYDRKRNVEEVESLLKLIKKRTSRQVLIEAKILEVILNDDHALGVSWEAVADSIVKNGDQLVLQQTLGLAGTVAGTMQYTTDNFASVITALDESGDVDTLSNPRIKVLSGESALITSGKLVPFWEKEVQTDQGTGGSASNTQVTYNRRDVLHGVSLGVTPTILEDGKIMLNVVPITSSIEDVIDYYDEEGNSVARAPVLNIKEAGTVIFAKNNELVLIGGLISNTKSTEISAIPLLSNIPFIGELFKNTVTKSEQRELVLLLKLNVIE